MELARQWLAPEGGNGDVAILDATNVSRARRRLMEGTLTDHPLLFVECLNEDQELLRACIRRKTALPEYAGYAEEAALENFQKRISYYENIYEPLRHEKFWLRVDSTANRILAEHPREGCAYYPAIREIVVSVWVHCLYLVRHGQTEFNLQGRIGGDPPLTEHGRAQAAALAEHLRDRPIDWVFTSTRLRSHQTAAPLLAQRPHTHVMAFREFDEIWAGDCEGLRYAEIRQRMPQVASARNADKYGFAYPKGESYAMLRERVQRGLRHARVRAGGTPRGLVGPPGLNRVLLALFLRQRQEDIPYIYVPQDQYYHISLTPRRKVFERLPYTTGRSGGERTFAGEE
jgi:broad specificity phosphatase PhoE